MEIRDYLAILWRRRWILVLVPALVLVGIIVQAVRAHPSYTATARMIATRIPQETPTTVFRYDEYYNYLASEYTLDDFTEVIRGNVFASDVAQALKAQGIDLTPAKVQDAISVSRRNRALAITVTATTPEEALAIARTAAQVLEQHGTAYFGFTDPQRQALIKTIDQPVEAKSNRTRLVLIWVAELLVGIVGGILVAFFVDYLVDTLDAPEAAQAALGLPVLGVVQVRR